MPRAPKCLVHQEGVPGEIGTQPLSSDPQYPVHPVAKHEAFWPIEFGGPLLLWIRQIMRPVRGQDQGFF
jgi:hypothetical protein